MRVHQKLKQQKGQAALTSAKLLEVQERWKDAEQSYLDLLKSDPGAEREVASALEKIRPKLRGPRRTEAFDELAAKISRRLLILSIFVVLTITVLAIVKTRRSIQFVPFTASTDENAKQIVFWLQRSRLELKSAALPLSSSPEGLPHIMAPT